MNEDQAQNLVMDYLYAELDPRREAEFERHLEECQECRQEVEALRGIVASYRGLPVLHPPANVASIALARARGVEPKPEPKPAAVAVESKPGPITRPVVTTEHQSPQPLIAAADDKVIPMPRRFAFHPAWGLAAVLILVFTVLIAMPDLKENMGKGFLRKNNIREKQSLVRTPAAPVTAEEERKRPRAENSAESKSRERAKMNRPALMLAEKDERTDREGREDDALIKRAPEAPALPAPPKGAGGGYTARRKIRAATRSKAKLAKVVTRKPGRMAANNKAGPEALLGLTKSSVPARPKPTPDFKFGKVGGDGGAGFAQTRKREFRKVPTMRARAASEATADKLVVRKQSGKALRSRKKFRDRDQKDKAQTVPGAPPATANAEIAPAKPRTVNKQKSQPQPLLARVAEVKADRSAVAEGAFDGRLKRGNARYKKAGPVNAGKRNDLPTKKKTAPAKTALAVKREQIKRAPHDAAKNAQAYARQPEKTVEQEVASKETLEAGLFQQAQQAFARKDYTRTLDLLARAASRPGAKTMARTAALLALKAECEIKLGSLDAAQLTLLELQKHDPATAASLARKLRALRSTPAKPRESPPAPTRKPARKFSTDSYDE